MRGFFGALVLLALAATATSAQAPKEEKKDDNATKIVGKWAPIGPDNKLLLPLTEEFTQDGKYYFGARKDPKTKPLGTYKVEGNTLTITVGDGAGTTTVQKAKIKTLDDTDLSYTLNGRPSTLKRLK
jgi:uncharacterized protein (TIGR03066 family)